MAEIVLERTGLPSRDFAEKVLAIFALQGQFGEVVPEAGGQFTLRVFPASYGKVGPATNTGTNAASVNTGAAGGAVGAGVERLLDYIAQLESGGNYNAYFRSAGNQTSPRFTTKTLREVIDWQVEFTTVNGSPSSACGRYQIIRKTLVGLIGALGLDTDTVTYSETTQDDLAVHLLNHRGMADYVSGAIGETRFANNLAKEWASLPVVSAITGNKGFTLQPGQSFYAGDGLNKALTGTETFLRAVRGLRA